MNRKIGSGCILFGLGLALTALFIKYDEDSLTMRKVRLYGFIIGCVLVSFGILLVGGKGIRTDYIVILATMSGVGAVAAGLFIWRDAKTHDIIITPQKYKLIYSLMGGGGFVILLAAGYALWAINKVNKSEKLVAV